MPFLVPAVTALACDVFVLWLSSRAPVGRVFAADADHWVYHCSWTTVPACLLRLVLLTVPLLFHSYTGTAVRHAPCYRAFYGTTAIILLLHMVGLALVNPESLQALFPLDITKYTRHQLENLHELRRLWWMLWLSAGAVLCHAILLQHVRSTAPAASHLRASFATGGSGRSNNNNYHGLYGARGGGTGAGSKTKPPTVYFAVRATSQEPALVLAMSGTSKKKLNESTAVCTAPGFCAFCSHSLVRYMCTRII